MEKNALGSTADASVQSSGVNKSITAISIGSGLSAIDADQLAYINKLKDSGQCTITVSSGNATYKINAAGNLVTKS